jgi:hypothetical protein
MQFIRFFFLIAAITLASLPNTAIAQSEVQAQFNQANDALEQGQFDQALTQYEAIRQSGFESGPLYLNMGITATRLDSLGLAKFYYLNAQQFDNVSIAATEALDFVDYELGRRGARLPELAWTRITRLLYFEMNHHSWLAFGFIAINLGVLFLVASWLRQSFQKINRYLAIVLICIGGSVVFITAIISWQSTGYTQGIQIVREAQIYAQPDAQTEIVQTGYEGFQYIVDIEESASTPDWLYVRLSNGSRGWVLAEHLNLY